MPISKATMTSQLLTMYVVSRYPRDEMIQSSIHPNPRVRTPYGYYITATTGMQASSNYAVILWGDTIERLKRGMLGMMIACMQSSIEDDDLEVEKPI